MIGVGRINDVALYRDLLKLLDKPESKELIQGIIAKERGYGMPGDGTERFIPQPPGGDARGLLQKALDESAGGDKGPVDINDLVRAGVVEGAKELIEAGKV